MYPDKEPVDVVVEITAKTVFHNVFCLGDTRSVESTNRYYISEKTLEKVIQLLDYEGHCVYKCETTHDGYDGVYVRRQTK